MIQEITLVNFTLLAYGQGVALVFDVVIYLILMELLALIVRFAFWKFVFQLNEGEKYFFRNSKLLRNHFMQIDS